MVNLDIYAQECLHSLTLQLTESGIKPNPALRIKQGKGLLCHYNRADGNLYTCFPDGTLATAVLCSLMSCPTQEELEEVFYLLMPWLIGHELTHHLRHYYEIETDNWWYEEQHANLLSGSLNTFDTETSTILHNFVDRAMNGLVAHIPDPVLVKAGYSIEPDSALANSSYLYKVINPLNDQYARNNLQALYCSLVWLDCYLTYKPGITLQQALTSFALPVENILTA